MKKGSFPRFLPFFAQLHEAVEGAGGEAEEAPFHAAEDVEGFAEVDIGAGESGVFRGVFGEGIVRAVDFTVEGALGPGAAGGGEREVVDEDALGEAGRAEFGDAGGAEGGEMLGGLGIEVNANRCM